MDEEIRLQAFEEGDFDQLIAEVPDARFLLQWAGPKYIYPLDASLLNDARTFNGENWNVIKMNLNRARWQYNNRND